MNSYILLRNTKETGPFSLEALQQMGLKSTDLIWVECQSMNWRHPNEITELKALLADDSNPVPGNSKQQLPPDDSKMVEITADTLIDKKLVFAELPTVTKPVNEKKKSLETTNLVLSDSCNNVVYNNNKFPILFDGKRIFIVQQGKSKRELTLAYKTNIEHLVKGDISNIAYNEQEDIFAIGSNTSGLYVLKPKYFSTLAYGYTNSKSRII